MKYFQITCVHICISLNTNDNTPITSHMSDFVLILSLLYCWLFDDSALVFGVASEKDKNNSVKLVSWEVFLKNQIFNHFYDSY